MTFDKKFQFFESNNISIIFSFALDFPRKLENSLRRFLEVIDIV